MIHSLHVSAYVFLCVACVIFVGSWFYRGKIWSWKNAGFTCLFLVLLIGEGLDMYLWPVRGPDPSVARPIEYVEAAFQFVFGAMVLGLLYFDYRHDQKQTQKDELLEELERSLATKKVLLAEIHHRVKNNLQVVLSLIRLRQRRIDESEYEQEFNRLESKILSISMIHERLYQQDEHDRVETDQYFEELVEEIGKLYSGAEPIDLRCEIDSFSLPMDRAISCGIVVSELLFNAFAHAMDGGIEQGWIDVSLDLDEENVVTLSVTDSGEESFSDSTDWSQETLGQKIVTNVTENQLGGQVVWGDTGSEKQVSIQFPVAGKTSLEE